VAPGIAEERQVVAPGKSRQLFIGGKGQGIQVRKRRPRAIDGDALSAFPDQAVDSDRIYPGGKLRQRRLPLPRNEIIDMGKVLKQGFPQSGDVNTAEDGADAGRFGLDCRGHLPAVEKSGRRSGKPHHLRRMREDEAHILLHPGDGPGTEAIVDMDGMAFPLQIGRNGEEPQGGHPVGRRGDVLFAGYPVGPGRVDQNDAHGESYP